MTFSQNKPALILLATFTIQLSKYCDFFLAIYRHKKISSLISFFKLLSIKK